GRRERGAARWSVIRAHRRTWQWGGKCWSGWKGWTYRSRSSASARRSARRARWGSATARREDDEVIAGNKMTRGQGDHGTCGAWSEFTKRTGYRRTGCRNLTLSPCHLVTLSPCHRLGLAPRGESPPAL